MAMHLVESYVREVRQYLPADSRDEIAGDLQSALEEEVYAAADDAGHGPVEDDERAVLARFGHPLKTATRYLPQRYLIGPDLFPAYLQTLRVLVVVALAAQVVVGLVLAQAQDWQIGLWQLFGLSLEILFWVFAIVTGVFVALEYSGERLRWYERWTPDKVGLRTLGVVDRSDVITNLLSEGFFLLWWNYVVQPQNMLPDGVFTLALAPVWDSYFWHLNVLFGACFVLHLYVLIQGVWVRRTALTEIVLNAAMVGFGIAILSGGDLVVVGGDLIEAGTMENVQWVVRVTIAVIMGFVVYDIWLAFRQIRRQF